MTGLLSRVVALVVLLLVPLTLAVASQALASRPGAPEVDPAPVRLEPGGAPAAPDETPGEPGPRVVDPVVPSRGDDADDDGPDDRTDGDDADDADDAEDADDPDDDADDGADDGADDPDD